MHLAAAEDTTYGLSLIGRMTVSKTAGQGSSPWARASTFGNFPAGKIIRVDIMLIV